MKRTVFLIFILLSMLCACSKEIVYQTMYIDNCQYTELREEPSNSSKIIKKLECGDPVSYEQNEKNGYAKVVHNGDVGYVLSVMLSKDKPVANKEIVKKNTATKGISFSYAKKECEYLISNLPDKIIDEHVSQYIRPLCNRINDELDNYTRSESKGVTVWMQDNQICKKEIEAGTDDYNMSRQYYYEPESGNVLFAFVFAGKKEYRLYFYNNKLIRVVGPDDVTVNNPTDTYSLQMGNFVLNDA